MNILFIHQNFPGQFKSLAPALVAAGHRVHAFRINGSDLPKVKVHRYTLGRNSSRGIHPWAADFESKMIRGEACGRAANQLKETGFMPDVIVANPSWGESLFLKDVWPAARMLNLFEFFYATHDLDCNFDPEFSVTSWETDARLRAKNAPLLMALQGMDAGWCPMHFQKNTLPVAYRDQVSVIFDGIDTKLVKPDPQAALTLNGRTFNASDEVITFVNRNLEPMRGYHIFMRALPEILRQRPNAIVLIVGGDGVSYGAAPPNGKSWKQIFLDEVKDQLDLSRVLFLDRIPYHDYLKLLQVSSCHVYLTYPFVLGWSCLEAMSAGCLVVGSSTAPVQEVIQHEENGLLVDFFDVEALSKTVIDCLSRPAQYAHLRLNARKTVVNSYDLYSICLPQQMRLVEGEGRIKRSLKAE